MYCGRTHCMARGDMEISKWSMWQVSCPVRTYSRMQKTMVPCNTFLGIPNVFGVIIKNSDGFQGILCTALAARCKIRTRATNGLLGRTLRCETLKILTFPAVSRLDFDQESSFSPSRAFCNGLLGYTAMGRPPASSFRKFDFYLLERWIPIPVVRAEGGTVLHTPIVR